MKKKSTSKLKKTILVATISIVVFIILIIAFASPIAKHLVKKYDVKYTGRQITLGRVYVNPLTGVVYIRNLKIFESDSLPELTKSDSIFFSAKSVTANISLHKLFSKTIEISKLTLNKPKGKIIQSKKDFNFNDLIKTFTSEKTDTVPSPIHFNMLNIRIKNGEFYYCDKITPINYFIKKVNIESDGFVWDADTIATNFSFYSGTGNGSIKGDFSFNFKSMDYNLAVLVDKFDLDLLEQYLKDLSNYGTFRATLDADFKSYGNLNDPETITNKGNLVIDDFHFGKNSNDDYASFDKLVLTIIEMSPKKHIYLYDSIILSKPYFKYERYDYLDNLQTMFGENGTKISAVKEDPAKFNLILKIVDLIKILRKNLFKSDFKFNRVKIDKGIIIYNDYSISEKFSVEANPFNISADSIYKSRDRVEIFLKSEIKPYGNVSLDISINPKDSSYFDMNYKFKKIPVSMFNPYLISYSSYTLDRGTLELTGVWKVRNGNIKSDNHLLVIDPRVGNRIKNEDTNWLPMPLIMFLARDRGNVIDYEIPITGNLNDPNFRWYDVVSNVLGNIFTKTPTTPYRSHVKNIETEIEKSLTLKWEMRQNELLPKQEKFIINMIDFLIINPDASIDVYPINYIEKEKEQILFFEAKKKYFLLQKDINEQILSKNDFKHIDRMSVKDSNFVEYLNKQVNNNMVFTIQEKCIKFIGSEQINFLFEKLCNERKTAFLLHFKKLELENRVNFYPEENTVPYNGFSIYKINYNGELPESLIKANDLMNDLNSEAPRKKFEKKREKSNT